MPEGEFIQALKNLPARMAARLAFMSPEHHAVRNFVVRELPRHSRPLSPRQIARGTSLEVTKVSRLLAELEKNLFFLVCDSRGNVSWAFPVTTSRTPHRLTFSTGEHTAGA